jgi:DNA-directed RNA polymerase specialized sigma24 family protein
MTTDGEPPGMVNANAEKAAELFDRYYNRLYDFCLRVLGLPDAATDATQEAFQNAMVAPQWGSSFDIILFSAALDSLEPRLKLRHPSSIGSNPLFHQVDVARLADPTRAPTAQETGGLIWETMSRLDPADYVLLDLRFRQNLDEADLAAVLRTNERAIHTRLTNLLRRTEPELSSLIVGRRGSRSCEGMRRAMLGLPIAATREQVRKAVEKHARSCPVCTATRAGLTSPLLVLASFALVTPAAAESGTARAKLLAAASAIPSTLSVAPEHIPAPLPDVGPAAPPPPPPPPQPAVPSGAGGFGEKTAFGGSGGAGMGGAGGFGGGYMSGMGRGGSGRLFGGLQLPSGMALPILGIVIIFALALLIACGTGLFAGGGGGKPTPTATAAKKPAATATAKPVDTPTTEEGTPTEEPTATPEEGQPPAASATPVPPTIGPATNTPVPPPTDTPAAPPTDTPAPVTPEGSATPCLPENGCFT